MSLNESIPDPHFRRAVELMDAGEVEQLRRHLAAHPGLAAARVRLDEPRYFSQPSLLEFIAENPIRTGRMPPNVVEVARTLVEAGADETSRQRTLGLVASGRIAREAGQQVALVEFLCGCGADPQPALIPALGHGEFEAVEALLRAGAKLDLPTAAATGRAEALRQALPKASTDERHRALALACQHGQVEAARLLLEAGEDPNRFNPEGCHAHSTPLHQAVSYGHGEIVELLLAHGASLNTPDKLWNATPLGWARHAGRDELVERLADVNSL
ncbi:MAG: ankyrin repeat domain-containing protein [Candidatus Eremiobacteraeota bacterium]|nr:ankyrin repeat domain-containing protein [Candidatus Eremiobacteraeota bacterium]